MNTREIILNILMRVFYENGYASLLMRSDAIPEQDMGFASYVVYGTIRNYLFLESQWHRFAKKASRRTAVILDMTIYQLFYMKTPAYAVVDEAVSLAAKKDRKFVNAVLRSIQREGLKMPKEDTLEGVSLKTSHPLWILKMWQAHYGLDNAVGIATHDQQPSRIYGRINTIRAEKEEIMQDENAEMINDTCFLYHGALQKTEMFKDGLVLIQDRNSQQVVRKLEVQKGMKVLDACAAPGTKTQQIACLMENEGEIIAGELHEGRVGLIEDLMKKTGVRIVQAHQQDATAENSYEPESFDRILIDAPCSGLGDLSHKPEIRYHLRPEDIDEIVSVQKKILDVNSGYLKAGGIMVYSTCTLNKKENENQIRAFLKNHPDFVLKEEQTMFPMEHDADGFYYAVMKRSDDNETDVCGISGD